MTRERGSGFIDHALALAAGSLLCVFCGAGCANPRDEELPRDSGSEVSRLDASYATDVSAGNLSIDGRVPELDQPSDLSVDAEMGDADPSASHGDVGTHDTSDVEAASNPVLAVGGIHSCLLRNESVYCWGSNGEGQLGTGTSASSPTAVQLPDLAGAKAITAGYKHTCAILRDAQVACWGDNSAGQLGLGPGKATNSRSPIRVPSLSHVRAIAAGSLHTCAVRIDGSVFCWGGETDNSLLGDGRKGRSSAPVRVDAPPGIVSLSAGTRHTCALADDASLWCWGENDYGMLIISGAAPTPVHLPGLNDIKSVACGSLHTCALLGDSTIRCWGRSVDGALGSGGGDGSVSPVKVEQLMDVTTIAAGRLFSCALTRDGRAWCWGQNTNGQLGNGARVGSSLPVTVEGLKSAAVSIGAGLAHTCVATNDFQILCWGSNNAGQLGDGTTQDSLRPVSVIGL